jgi:hypothetical protein
MPTTRMKAKTTDATARTRTAVNPICRRLFSIDQAAEFAGVRVQLIRRWIKTRKLEAYALEGGIRIDESSLPTASRPGHPSSRSAQDTVELKMAGSIRSRKKDGGHASNPERTPLIGEGAKVATDDPPAIKAGQGICRGGA